MNADKDEGKKQNVGEARQGRYNRSRKIDPMPVILFGSKHWKRLVDWDYLAECELIGPNDMDLITFCDNGLAFKHSSLHRIEIPHVMQY